jgi:hypothetical protein
MSGNIRNAGDQEVWCLNARGGTTYRIALDLATLRDTVLEVYDPSGRNRLAQDDDGGSGGASYLEWTAPGSGTYRLVASGYGSQTGTYEISVSSSVADDPCQSGTSLQGSGDIFFSDSYEDNASCQWTVSCSSGHPQIHFNNFNTEHNFDYVSLYDGSSTSATRIAHLSGSMSDLEHTDYSGNGRAVVIEFSSDGSVSGTGFDASYSCSTPSSSSSSCTTISPSSGALVGNIASANEKDWYCLSARGGQTYAIDVDCNAGSLGDSVLEVYSPDGRTKIAENDDGGSGTASYLEWTAPSTGNYRLAVRGYSSHTGTYTIQVGSSAATDPCQGGAQLTGSGDIFFSDQYENDAHCQWLLSCTSGYPHVHFSRFTTESNYDFVNIYDGSSSSSSRLAHLSGSSLSNRDYIASNHAMTVEFTADGSVAGGGFDLSYSCDSHHRRMDGGLVDKDVAPPVAMDNSLINRAAHELTDDELLTRFADLHALLKALLNPPSDGSAAEYKGIPCVLTD